MVRNLVYAALSLAAASGAALSSAHAEQLVGSQSVATVGCAEHALGHITVCPNESTISCLGSSDIKGHSILDNSESVVSGRSKKRLDHSAGIVLTVCRSDQSDRDVRIERGPYTHGAPLIIQ